MLCGPSLGWVDLSVINGEIIVKDGTLLTLDVQVRTQLLAVLQTLMQGVLACLVEICC